MRYLTRLFLALSFFSLTAASQEDDTTEVADFALYFNSSRTSKSISGSVNYSRYFTEDLYFNFNTNLGDEYNAREKRSVETRGFSTQLTYDPVSPWYLGVSYYNSKNYNYRPQSPDVDEYKALTVSNSLSSSLRYTYADDLRTYFDVHLGNSKQESIVAGEPNPDTYRESKRISLRADYDLTANTVVNGGYEAGISKNEYVGSQYWRTDPETPAVVGRTKSYRLNGSSSSNNNLSDSLTLDTNISANLDTDKDEILVGLDRDALSGYGGANVKFTPATEFTFDAGTSLSRSKNYYPNKDEYEETFGTRIFDSVDKYWSNSAKVTISPSPQVSTDVAYERSDSGQRRYDENDLPPNIIIYPDAVRNIYDRMSETFRSNVNVSVGEDLTFHLTYYLSGLETDYILDRTLNSRSVVNNLDSNIGYDFSEDLRADVRTQMNINHETFDDVSKRTQNNEDAAILLTSAFTYNASDDTKMTTAFHISANRSSYEYTPTSDAETFDRYFSGAINQDFTDMLDITLGAKVGRSLSNYPHSSRSNRESKYYDFTPSAVLDVSEALTFTANFGFKRTIDWYPNDEAWVETWRQTDNYTTRLSTTYRIFEDFNVNFNASNTHQLKIEDKNLRKKTYPDESFFTVSASASYQW